MASRESSMLVGGDGVDQYDGRPARGKEGNSYVVGPRLAREMGGGVVRVVRSRIGGRKANMLVTIERSRIGGGEKSDMLLGRWTSVLLDWEG